MLLYLIFFYKLLKKVNNYFNFFGCTCVQFKWVKLLEHGSREPRLHERPGCHTVMNLPLQFLLLRKTLSNFISVIGEALKM